MADPTYATDPSAVARMQALLAAARRAAQIWKASENTRGAALGSILRGVHSNSGAYLMQALEEAGWLLVEKGELEARDERVLDLEADVKRLTRQRDWFRDAHELGSEILHDLRLPGDGIAIPEDMRDQVEEWHTETFFPPGSHPSDVEGDEDRHLLVERSFNGLVDVARRMLAETYPPDIFVGGGTDTDPGVAFVVALREALDHVKSGEALEGGTTHDG